MIIFVVAFACVLICACLILFNMHRCAQMKARGGIEIQGKIIDYKEIPGQPTRYMMLVEYQIDSTDKRKRIITTDKAARRFAKEENIALMYVESLDKVYWADDKKFANM